MATYSADYPISHMAMADEGGTILNPLGAILVGGTAAEEPEPRKVDSALEFVYFLFIELPGHRGVPDQHAHSRGPGPFYLL